MNFIFYHNILKSGLVEQMKKHLQDVMNLWDICNTSFRFAVQNFMVLFPNFFSTDSRYSRKILSKITSCDWNYNYHFIYHKCEYKLIHGTCRVVLLSILSPFINLSY